MPIVCLGGITTDVLGHDPLGTVTSKFCKEDDSKALDALATVGGNGPSPVCPTVSWVGESCTVGGCDDSSDVDDIDEGYDGRLGSEGSNDEIRVDGCKSVASGPFLKKGETPNVRVSVTCLQQRRCGRFQDAYSYTSSCIKSSRRMPRGGVV